jgi:hypothetical protein
MQSFPKTQVVVDPEAQMTKAVAALRVGSGALSSADLESQLAEKSTQRSGNMSGNTSGGMPIVQIDYQNNVLKVLP